MQACPEFFCVDRDVVFAYLIERILQVLLNVVQADEEYAEERRDDVHESRREIQRDLGEVRAVYHGEDVDEESTMGVGEDGAVSGSHPVSSRGHRRERLIHGGEELLEPWGLGRDGPVHDAGQYVLRHLRGTAQVELADEVVVVGDVCAGRKTSILSPSRCCVFDRVLK